MTSVVSSSQAFLVVRGTPQRWRDGAHQPPRRSLCGCCLSVSFAAVFVTNQSRGSDLWLSRRQIRAAWSPTRCGNSSPDRSRARRCCCCCFPTLALLLRWCCCRGWGGGRGERVAGSSFRAGHAGCGFCRRPAASRGLKTLDGIVAAAQVAVRGGLLRLAVVGARRRR